MIIWLVLECIVSIMLRFEFFLKNILCDDSPSTIICKDGDDTRLSDDIKCASGFDLGYKTEHENARISNLLKRPLSPKNKNNFTNTHSEPFQALIIYLIIFTIKRKLTIYLQTNQPDNRAMTMLKFIFKLATKLSQILKGTLSAQEKYSVETYLPESENKDIRVHSLMPQTTHFLRINRTLSQTYTTFPVVNFTPHFTSGSCDQSNPTPHLHKEGVRLVTFRVFPSSVPVSAIRLAQAGFYYTGESDKVKCFCCSVTYHGWRWGDKPQDIHAAISPTCPLVLGQRSSNVPLPLSMTTISGYLQPIRILNGSFVLSNIDYENIQQHLSGVPSNLAPLNSRPSLAETDLRKDHFLPQVSSNPSSLNPPHDVIDFESRSQHLANLHLVNGFHGSVDIATLGHSFEGYDISSSQVNSGQEVIQNSHLTPSDRDAFGPLVPVPSTHLTHLNELPPTDASQSQHLTAARYHSLTILRSNGIYHNYYCLNNRLQSFHNVQDNLSNLPDARELAFMGFYYAGYADCVKCFYCGIGLRSWSRNEDPAERHAMYSPHCRYIRRVKGDDYVNHMKHERIMTHRAPDEEFCAQGTASPGRNLPRQQSFPRQGYNSVPLSQTESVTQRSDSQSVGTDRGTVPLTPCQESGEWNDLDIHD